MVTVVQLHAQNSAAALEPIGEGLEARDRAIREQEAQVERRREELRRMRAQIEELL